MQALAAEERGSAERMALHKLCQAWSGPEGPHKVEDMIATCIVKPMYQPDCTPAEDRLACFTFEVNPMSRYWAQMPQGPTAQGRHRAMRTPYEAIGGTAKLGRLPRPQVEINMESALRRASGAHEGGGERAVGAGREQTIPHNRRCGGPMRQHRARVGGVYRPGGEGPHRWQSCVC